MFGKAKATMLAAAFAVCSAGAVSAAPVTVGAGGFDNGYATQITYDDAAARGTADGRDNAANALGATDGSFFEIGFGSYIELTFGKLFDTSVSVFEVTFDDVAGWPESADLFVGIGGVFTKVAEISNLDAVSGVVISLGAGLFDTIKLVDTTDTSLPVYAGKTFGGFDVDSVRVTPVPLPAGALLLVTAIGGLAMVRRKQA